MSYRDLVLSNEITVAVATEITKSAAKFLEETIGQPLKDLTFLAYGAALQERVIERCLKFAKRMQPILDQRGVQLTLGLPDNVRVPLIQAVALEDDPDLIEMWASLTASALDPDSVNQVTKQHTSTVAAFTSSQARLFKLVANVALGYSACTGVREKSRARSNPSRNPFSILVQIAISDPAEVRRIATDMEILETLGLIKSNPEVSSPIKRKFESGEIMGVSAQPKITSYGWDLIEILENVRLR